MGCEKGGIGACSGHNFESHRSSETETEAERSGKEAHHRRFQEILGREAGCCQEILVTLRIDAALRPRSRLICIRQGYRSKKARSFRYNDPL